MKKGVLLAILLIASMGFVLAQEKIDVSLIKESFSPGENISFRVSLLDENNNPIPAGVDILAQDAEKRNEISSKVNSNELASLNLGDKALSGYWRIIASYNDNKAIRIFSIESRELAKFEIQGDRLVITNTGNTDYVKTIQIVIGDSIGAKEIALGVGESTSFRLIAPDGSYNIKVSDGKTSLIKENVALLGNVIGVLDEKLLEPSSITGGVKPEKGFTQNFKNNAVVYIFLLLVTCAFILVVIERRYRRKYFGR